MALGLAVTASAQNFGVGARIGSGFQAQAEYCYNGSSYIEGRFGMNWSNILFKQILPNVMSPIIVSTTTNVAFFILQEAALSFIGLGVADSTPTWGNILNAAKSVAVVTDNWWIWVFPGAAITLFVLAINFFGDGLRDVLDAKQQ